MRQAHDPVEKISVGRRFTNGGQQADDGTVPLAHVRDALRNAGEIDHRRASVGELESGGGHLACERLRGGAK